MQEREEGCGLRRAAGIEARECARTSQLIELQKSIGDHCWSHRSSFTGQKAGSLARAMGSERGPSPRRRTLLTREKSRAEAEPRANQASRGEGRCVAEATSLFTQARFGETTAHEGPSSEGPAARRASRPRRGASPAYAKWPLSMEGVRDSHKPLPFTRRWQSESWRLPPGRTHAKA